MLIESVQNKKVKEIIKYHNKKFRDKEKKFLVEGFHLIEEALNYKNIELIVLRHGVTFDTKDVETIEVSERVFDKLSTAESSQGILGLCSQLNHIPNNEKKIILLDRIQDPGNLGTIIRSADAFGCDLVVLGDGCCDLYNQKVIRSTQGSLYHIPIIKQNLSDYLENFNGFILGTALENSKNIDEVELNHDRLAIIVGNEGKGISGEVLALTNQNVIIEMPGKSESLNVGVAASIILYEVSKQRK